MLFKNISIVIMALIINSLSVHAQERILLYPGGAAESNGLTVAESFRSDEFILNISEPRMDFFPAPGNNRPAVLICPGGGYSGVSHIKEGEEIALWFNERGVSAFVLYYRMPNAHAEIPLKDAQAALEMMHANARKWKLNTRKIGIMGFSAGGHLAASAATLFTSSKNRPAFVILGYPVITMMEHTHGGSRTNLLGRNPDEALIQRFSTELQVTTKTPPAFVFHAADDGSVPIANSERFVAAMKEKGVPAELYAFPKGGHGFGMRKTNPEADQWPYFLNEWLKKQKVIR